MNATTGIQDDEELKQHIIAVQHKAFAVRYLVLRNDSPLISDGRCICMGSSTGIRVSVCSSS